MSTAGPSQGAQHRSPQGEGTPVSAANSRGAAAPAAPAAGMSRPHESARAQVAGAATYVDDMPVLRGTLHAAHWWCADLLHLGGTPCPGAQEVLTGNSGGTASAAMTYLLHLGGVPRVQRKLAARRLQLSARGRPLRPTPAAAAVAVAAGRRTSHVSITMRWGLPRARR